MKITGSNNSSMEKSILTIFICVVCVCAFMGCTKNENPTCPSGMVLIPGGEFTIGGEVDPPCFEYSPVLEKRTVKVEAFCIDVYEYPNVKGEIPRGNVKFRVAESMCEEIGKRLPTEAEWEFAARDAGSTEYELPDPTAGDVANYCDQNCEHIWKAKIDDGYTLAAPSGTYPNGATLQGVMDMYGNLMEWVDTEIHYEIEHQETGMKFKQSTNLLKGGCWNSRYSDINPMCRYPSSVGSKYFGFRCAKNPD